MQPTKLTAAVLGKLAPGERVWDTTVRGLIAHRGARGVAWRIQADLWQHGRLVRTVKATIGKFPAVTVDAARAEAQRQLGAIHAGHDPHKPASDRSVWTLGRAIDAYASDALKARGDGAQRTVDDMRSRARRHLADWMDRPLDSLTPLECRLRHDEIRAAVKARARTEAATGAKTANAVLGDVRAVFGLAMKVFPAALASNPVRAVRFSRERKAHQFLQLEEFPVWRAAVEDLANPIRKAMHWVALLSGLRPTNVRTMRTEWIDFAARVVRFPASEMKARRQFDLPLSEALATRLSDALAAGKVWHPGSPWAFPARDRDGATIATAVVKEKTMPSHFVGHSLRHSYSNVCELIGLDGDTRQMLLAQKVAGVRGTYLTQEVLFTRLLEAQERITTKILDLTESKVQPAPLPTVDHRLQ